MCNDTVTSHTALLSKEDGIISTIAANPKFKFQIINS